MRYFQLWGEIGTDDAILDHEDDLDLDFSNWLGTEPWQKPVPNPMRAVVETPGILRSYYSNPFPLITESLLTVMRKAGADNVIDYPALIIDPHSGKEYTNYRVLKITKAIAAVDEQASEGEALDDEGEMMFYDEIVVDESKVQGDMVFRLDENLGYLVMAEPIMQALHDAPDSDNLRFKPLFPHVDDDDEIDPDLAGLSDEELYGYDYDDDIEHD